MLERTYQAQLKARIETLFPGCVVLKLDTADRQGIPDLLVLYRRRWATLEVKRSANAPEQPNQAYYQQLLDRMSYSAFIYPENEEEVLNDLQQAFRITKRTRIS
jgi:hypothetical protein